jgi:hypothetical protein
LTVTGIAVLLWRRSQNPGLDVSVLRRPGTTWVIAATALTSIVNFAYFAALWLQSQPGADTTSTAAYLTIPQLAAVAAGIAGGRLAAGYGPFPVAIIACLIAAGERLHLPSPQRRQLALDGDPCGDHPARGDARGCRSDHAGLPGECAPGYRGVRWCLAHRHPHGRCGLWRHPGHLPQP